MASVDDIFKVRIPTHLLYQILLDLLGLGEQIELTLRPSNRVYPANASWNLCEIQVS